MDPQVASFGAGCLQNAAAAGELECLGCLGHPAFRREQYGTINRKVLSIGFFHGCFGTVAMAKVRINSSSKPFVIALAESSMSIRLKAEVQLGF